MKSFGGFNKIYQNTADYGIWYELTLETLTQQQKVLFSLTSPMVLNHLSECIQKIGKYYLWIVFLKVFFAGLIACDLIGYVALIFSLLHIKQLNPEIQMALPALCMETNISIVINLKSLFCSLPTHHISLPAFEKLPELHPSGSTSSIQPIQLMGAAILYATSTIIVP